MTLINRINDSITMFNFIVYFMTIKFITKYFSDNKRLQNQKYQVDYRSIGGASYTTGVLFGTYPSLIFLPWWIKYAQSIPPSNITMQFLIVLPLIPFILYTFKYTFKFNNSDCFENWYRKLNTSYDNGKRNIKIDKWMVILYYLLPMISLIVMLSILE